MNIEHKDIDHKDIEHKDRIQISDNMECVICFEKFKKYVTCVFCESSFCFKCSQKYILDETVHPRCPSCFKPWTRQTIYEFYGKTFINTKYKIKREKDLFETEKALLPETQRQMAINDEIDRRRIENYTLRKILINIDSQLKYANRIYNGREEFIDALKTCSTKLRKLITQPAAAPSQQSIHKPRTFKCQNQIDGEQCRGFVTEINKEYTCSLCQTKVCKECREKETDDHQCDQSIVETVKLINMDTKPCPKCSISIFKIDGCDQMYCTSCNTAFSWKTLEIVTSRIHNPHYYEYMRQNGGVPREVGDNCVNDALPPLNTLNEDVFWFHRTIEHVRNVEIPRYAALINNNNDLRIKFLRKKLTEKEFVKLVQQRDKMNDKNREIREVLVTFVEAGIDVLRSSPTNSAAINVLLKFINTAFENISKIYNMGVPQISTTGDIKVTSYNNIMKNSIQS